MLNVRALKNVITATPPESPNPSTTNHPDLAAKIKGLQLLRGRTRTRVDTLLAELESARRSLAQAEHTLGERVGDKLDATEATAALHQASDRVRGVEVALTVARQKDDLAQADLKTAERQASDAADDEVVGVLKTAALKVEQVLQGELKRAVDELGAALKGVKDRGGDDTGVASALTDLAAWFPIYLARACCALTPQGRNYSDVLDKQRKPFSDWVDNIAYAVAHRRRRGQ